VTKAELHEQIEEMTEEEAAETMLAYAPDWPDKITPIAEGIARRRAAEQPEAPRTFDGGTRLPD